MGPPTLGFGWLASSKPSSGEAKAGMRISIGNTPFYAIPLPSLRG